MDGALPDTTQDRNPANRTHEGLYDSHVSNGYGEGSMDAGWDRIQHPCILIGVSFLGGECMDDDEACLPLHTTLTLRGNVL
jgi:hypothetical protein